MRRDELKQPLHKRSLMQRLWAKRPSALAVAYVVTASSLVAGSIWISRQPMPFAGEPIVMVAVPPPEEIKTASIETVADAAPADENIDEAPPEKIKVTVEPPVEQRSYQQDATIFVISKQPLAKAPMANMVELTPDGAMPRMAGGRKPADAYARPVSMGLIHSEAPKIVLILGGMGLNEKLTASAARDLPADISFAFAPYGNNLQAQVDKVRSNGHEVLLQVPLEPVGFPASNPGPKTLLTDGTAGDNLAALYWHMTRFTGYTGVLNYMGGRFLASNTAVKPVLMELRKRGLLFVEDGSLPLSATEDVAKSLQFDVRRAQTVIDADPNPESIATALGLLEDEARNNGVAIGTGTGLDMTIKAVGEWAKAAQDRGVILLPASAAFKGRLG